MFCEIANYTIKYTYYWGNDGWITCKYEPIPKIILISTDFTKYILYLGLQANSFLNKWFPAVKIIVHPLFIHDFYR